VLASLHSNLNKKTVIIEKTFNQIISEVRIVYGAASMQ
jgi:hypothetical protein